MQVGMLVLIRDAHSKECDASRMLNLDLLHLVSVDVDVVQAKGFATQLCEYGRDRRVIHCVSVCLAPVQDTRIGMLECASGAKGLDSNGTAFKLRHLLWREDLIIAAQTSTTRS